MIPSIQIRNLSDIEAKLRRLPQTVAMGLGKKAVLAAAAIHESEVQRRVPVGPSYSRGNGVVHKGGTLKASVKIVGNTKDKSGQQRALVTTGLSGNLFAGQAYYGGFIEYGFHLGSRKLGGNRRMIAPRPFIRGSFIAAKSRMIDAIEQTLRSGLANV